MPRPAPVWLALLVWGALLVLGGFGAAMPLAGAALETGCALLIAALLVQRSRSAGAAARGGLVLLGAMFALPLLQLVPLPPALWQALAGRTREAAVLAELGMPARWMPLSMDPEATRSAMLGLLPAAALFLLTVLATAAERTLLVRILLGATLASALLGAVQLASGGDFTPIDTVHRGHALGLFANRNHQADFLLVAMLLLAALVPAGRAREATGNGDRWIASALVLMLGAAVLATSSRSGAALLLPVLPAAAALIWNRAIGWKSAAGAVAALGGGVLLALQTGAGQALLARFGSPDDDRLTFWGNMWSALSGQSLLGSGFGTFAAVYRSIEPLDQMTGQYVNHAHNDFLELLVEGGIPALVLVAALLGWIIRTGWLATRSTVPRAERRLAWAALGGLTLLLAHSVVDYPARMLLLAALAGLLCGLLVPAWQGSEGRRDRSLLRLALVVPVALAGTAQAAVSGAAALALQTNDRAMAEHLALLSPAAASLAARFRLEQGAAGADTLARGVLSRAPLDVQALSTLGQASDDAGRAEAAARLMNLAAEGGWWDFGTQLWLFDRARELGAHDVALQRADALLRRGLMADQLYPLLLEADSRSALVARLETRPAWRESYLEWLDRGSSEPLAVDALWARLATSSAPPGLRERARHAAALVRQSRFAAARASWTAGPLLADGSFAEAFRPHDERPDVPFEWRVDEAGTELAAQFDEERGSGLQVNAGAGFASSVMRQLLVLGEGTYRLDMDRLEASTGSGAGIEWRLRCVEGAPLPLIRDAAVQPRAGAWLQRSFAFTVPPLCAAQWLELQGTGSSLLPVDAAFRDLRIVMPNAR